MVRITISETYDLSTRLNKISLIGVHTPSMSAISKVYGGLVSNCKMVRFTKCDVKLACASVLPADPLQVGVEAGDIAPQDMFNPILYKAVSNQAMNEFELRMHGISLDTDTTSSRYEGDTIAKTDDALAPNTSATDNFKVYYTLLANRKGFKVAHPQRGLAMYGLRPLVYEKLYNIGDANDSALPTDAGEDVKVISSSSDNVLIGKEQYARALRGRARPLPALPIHTLIDTTGNPPKNAPYGVGNFDQLPWGKDMRIYTALICMPPAKLNKFYYRLVVRWHIDLFGIRPYNQIMPFGPQASMASTFYGSDYFPITSSKDNMMEMVDVENGHIEKIMEGA